MQNDIVPTFQLTLSDEEVDERIQEFGGDGSFAADLVFLCREAGDIIAQAEIRFWIEELGSRSEESVARFKVMTKLPDISSIAARFSTSSARRFQGPIDREWIELIAREAMILSIIQSTLPRRLMLRARIGDARRRAIAAAMSDRPEDMYRIFNTLHMFSLIETDIVSAEITARERDRSTTSRNELSSEFESNVHEIVSSVATDSSALQRRSSDTARSALGVLTKTSEVAAAAEQSATAMRAAAATASGLIDAIDRARSQVEVAAEIATQASEQAAQALSTSQALSDHAKAIESILGLIRSIAGQTNLLALNATIEAARAGDAGRGFAVVAQEVKSLASQTARAIDEVAVQIAAIQSATRATLEANGSIRETVANVQASAQGIRVAMEDQARTVGRITESVDETALAAHAMSSTVSDIRAATQSIASEIDHLATGISSVSGRFEELQDKANDFAAKMAA